MGELFFVSYGLTGENMYIYIHYLYIYIYYQIYITYISIYIYTNGLDVTGYFEENIPFSTPRVLLREHGHLLVDMRKVSHVVPVESGHCAGENVLRVHV